MKIIFYILFTQIFFAKASCASHLEIRENATNPAYLVYNGGVRISLPAFQDDPAIMTPASQSAEISIPKKSDWVNHGVVLEAGPPGSWDMRFHGMFSPSSVVKKGGTFFLYYIGADGDRTSDGGPRHRAIGVATSKDGLHFTKFNGNPIITHLPNNNEEEGCFSAAATLDENERVVLFYGAMDAGSQTSTFVDSDIRLAVSDNGFMFDDIGDVLSHSDSSVWGYGDELFPVGTFHFEGTWYLYYIAKGKKGVFWDLGLATGPSPKNIIITESILTAGRHIRGGGDPIFLSPDRFVLFLLRGFPFSTLEARIASINSPSKLSFPRVKYYTGVLQFFDAPHFTIFLDRDSETWFIYGLRTKDSIHLRTAPMSFIKTIP